MIEAHGVVLEVDRGFALVETERQVGCGHCASGGCATGNVSKLFGAGRRQFKVLNQVDAKPGDRVVVGIEDGALLKGALGVYVLPLALLVAGGVAGSALAPTPGIQEAYSIAGSALGLAAGILWVRFFSAINRANRRFQPFILEKRAAPQAGLIREST